MKLHTVVAKENDLSVSKLDKDLDERAEDMGNKVVWQQGDLTSMQSPPAVWSPGHERAKETHPYLAIVKGF